MILNIENLGVTLKSGPLNFQAVQEVSYSLDFHDTLAIVGESGSGKTVSQLAMLGLLPKKVLLQTKGLAFYQGKNLLKLPTSELQKIRGREIAIIFQEPLTSLNPYLTVQSQVEEPLKIHTRDTKQTRLKKVGEMLERVGLGTSVLKQYPHQLSGGMRQRVMIATALILHPKILIADEPTTALDVTVQAQILALLQELQLEFGMATIFITHDLGIVESIASKMIVMKGGVIVEKGLVSKILQTPEHPYTQKLLRSVPRLKDKTELGPPSQKLVLSLEKISIAYQKSVLLGQPIRASVVPSLSLSLKQGETLGIVGESGCGKTSLLKGIIDLLSLEGGSKITYSNRKNAIQMIFQDPFSSLDPRMTIEQILKEPLTIQRRPPSQDWILQLLEWVGIPSSALSKYPHEFSGGQRQRISIARALALEPEILIADEPVSSLDVSIQSQILDLLRDLQKKLQIAMLFVSHNLSVVKALSHRVAVIYLGRIVETGPTEEVFDDPKHPYTQLLLSSVFEPGEKKNISSKPFEPPSFWSRPKGCAFHPRCSYATPNCQQNLPELNTWSLGNHEAACFEVQSTATNIVSSQ